jgi:pyruvate formate lyase activating enzyme
MFPACSHPFESPLSQGRSIPLRPPSFARVIASAAKAAGCTSVAFTYNDPTIFAEYAMDTADACRALGLKAVAVTAGYIHAEPRVEMYAKMDAANHELSFVRSRGPRA